MDSKLILEAARGTLDGSLSFPDVVGQLLAASVDFEVPTWGGRFILSPARR